MEIPQEAAMKVERVYQDPFARWIPGRPKKTLTAAVAVGVLVAFPTIARSAEAGSVARLIGDRGCTVCHREAPPPPATSTAPLAPSWKDIAERYRGVAGAQKQLVRTVIQGADPKDRHWKNRQEFTSMGANTRQVTRDEATAMVRWILSRA
jgi:cytochrome c